MNSETLVASVQYNDLQGTTAADMNDDHKKVATLASKHGLDLSGYFVFGYKLWFGENHADRPQGSRVRLQLLCTKGSSFDGVQDQINEADGKLTYTTFKVDTTLEEAFDLFKRCEIVLTKKLQVSSFIEELD